MRASDEGSAAAEKGGEPRRPARTLPPAALRALAEAEARRLNSALERPVEIGGRGGEDPVRYGDWEVKGLAVDF